jgi:NADH-quinone oxidoreductase subunit J
MTSVQAWFAVAAALTALGWWWLLPGRRPRGRVGGMLLAAAGLLLLAALGLGATPLEPGRPLQVPAPLGGPAREMLFWLLAVTTVVAAVATVSMRSPVYCAIWFGLLLLGVAALFFFQGAQFLAVATVVVYAGAILVTFLFVLMLAHPRGHTHYDRLAWEGLLAACTGAVLVGAFTMTLARARRELPPPRASTVADRAQPPSAPPRAAGPEAEDHVARLGGQLFGTHLIAVEGVGTLLLVALVGAVAVAAHTRRGGPGGTHVGGNGEPRSRQAVQRPALPGGPHRG